MSQAARTGVDPITLEVLRNALPAVANDMSLDLQRSSYNMMIYEVRDYSCAILTADGALVAQNVGGVSHFVSDLGVVIRDGVERYGSSGFSPGDVVLTNHQAVAGQHLNNIVVYTPMFVDDDRLWGFAAIRAHWIDVGGMSTGFGAVGMAFDPWGEGLQLDQLKVVETGVEDEKVLKLIRDNIRFPESSFGDLRSQIAACRLAERRMANLCSTYSTPVVDHAVKIIFERTERHCHQTVEKIPDGVYEAESFLDGDAADPEPIEIRVRVTVSGSDMEIDLAGCSAQRRSALNSRTLAGALIAYKALTAPEAPVNEGSFAGVRVVLPEGNIMMARFPAPMARWSAILPTVVDTVLRALADAIPDRTAAGHFGVLGIPVVFFGIDPASGRRFVSQSIEGGGWGGRPSADGESASVSICQGDVRNSPIENIELKVPLVVEERGLLPDSGGPGKFRGGLGVKVRFRTLAEGRWNLNQSRRRGLPPWGLFGGHAGSTPDNLVRFPGETEFRSVDASHFLAPAGSVVIQTSAGGGGWGPALERDPQLVLADVREGLVSVESASRDYGVVIDPVSGTVDEPATRDRRAELASQEATLEDQPAEPGERRAGTSTSPPACAEMAERLHSLGLTDLGGDLVDLARRRVFDTLGALVAGLEVESSTILPQLRGRADREGRVLVQVRELCAAARSSELDDIDRFATVTPGSVAVPVALALAADRKTGTDAMLAGVIAGYEAMVSLGDALEASKRAGGLFWPSYLAAPFAAAATAARVIGLDPERTAHALAIAATRAAGGAGRIAGEPSSRWLTYGCAAADGVLAALAAEAGMKGDPATLEQSLPATASMPFDGAKFAFDGERGWRIARVDTKPFCTAYQVLSAVEAARAAHRELGSSSIELVEVAVPENYRSMIDRPQPQNRLDSIASVQFQIAAALTREELLFDVARRTLELPPAGTELMRVTRVSADDGLTKLFPDRWPASVRIRSADGREAASTVDHPTGVASVGWDELHEKHRRVAAWAERLDSALTRCRELGKEESATEAQQLLDTIEPVTR